MFYLTHDDFINTLIALQGKGVKVRFLANRAMLEPAHLPLLERLARAGVEMYATTSPAGGKMHLKCAIVDDDTVITGAANWTRQSFEMNFEDALIIRSPPLVEHYREGFEKLLVASEPLSLSSSQEVSPSSSNERLTQSDLSRGLPSYVCRDVPLAMSFFNQGLEARTALIASLRAATGRVDIAMYFLDDPQVVATLEGISRAGQCRVRLLMDQVLLGPWYLPRIQKLWDAGVEVLCYRQDRAILHLKAAVVDEEFVWTGSANWSTGAFERNIEDMLCFKDATLALRYLTFMDDIAAQCQSFESFALASPDKEPAPTPEPPREPEPVRSRVGFELPMTGPREDFDAVCNPAPTFPFFEVEARVRYVPDDEYLPVLLKLISQAHQSILITMYVMSEQKSAQPHLECMLRSLEQAVRRGVYVYMVLFLPTSPEDRLDRAHSNWAEKLRARGIDVRLALPDTDLHEKMVVVDLCKALIGSHNWSEGAISGSRVYESSALIMLDRQEPRFADYVFSRPILSDMRTREHWEREAAVVRHIQAATGKDREAMLERLRQEPE